MRRVPKAYYNEHDPFAAAWLRELINEGLIADGEVDERSIADVCADDLAGFRQVHFFAGIGGWSYALRLAGIPDDEPVWTGSCPCQPFSSAGKRKGTSDERHLWPEMFRLISQCRPATVFGEQVEAAVRLGWVDGVRGDLEGKGYAFGFHVLGSHSVKSPHIRQRIYWVASTAGPRYAGTRSGAGTDGIGPDQMPQRERSLDESAGRGADDRMANTDGGDSIAERKQCGGELRLQSISRGGDGAEAIKERADERLGNADSERESKIGSIPKEHGTECTRGPWSDARSILCRDGKQRRIPTQPSLFPLVNGVPNRVGLLRGAGNAIVPQVAAEFVKAFYEVRAEQK